MLDAPARLARNIAWLFNPVLYPEGGLSITISQEELGLLCGLSRQATNKSLQCLQDASLLSVEQGKLTALDLDRLKNYGE